MEKAFMKGAQLGATKTADRVMLPPKQYRLKVAGDEISEHPNRRARRKAWRENWRKVAWKNIKAVRDECRARNVPRRYYLEEVK